MSDSDSTRPTNWWLAFATSLVVIALWVGDRALDERAQGACLWSFGKLMWLTAVAIAATGVALYIFLALFWDLPLLRTAAQRKDARAAEAAAQIDRLKAVLKQVGVPDPPPDASQRATDLLDEGGRLHERVLRAKKAAKRGTSLPFAPTPLTDAVKAWNQGVLRLADACLPLSEASEVEGYPWMAPIVGPDVLRKLIESNTATLLRILELVKPQAQGPARG